MTNACIVTKRNKKLISDSERELRRHIVHVLQNTIDLCINSATDRRGYNNNNNNNANICIARLKQNSSGVLMAQTNTVSVFVQVTTVTASGVADRPEDCSKLLFQ